MKAFPGNFEGKEQFIWWRTIAPKVCLLQHATMIPQSGYGKDVETSNSRVGLARIVPLTRFPWEGG